LIYIRVLDAVQLILKNLNTASSCICLALRDKYSVLGWQMCFSAHVYQYHNRWRMGLNRTFTTKMVPILESSDPTWKKSGHFELIVEDMVLRADAASGDRMR
jgi:hypothetical protein